jgi:hypothetical protein
MCFIIIQNKNYSDFEINITVQTDQKQAINPGILVAQHILTVLSIAPLLNDDTNMLSDIINKLWPTVSFLFS